MTTAAIAGAPRLQPPLDDRLLLEQLGTDVAIVGAGPAGAALAQILATRGVRTLLVERHDDLAREFRGEGLQSSGLDCLREMGLAAELARVPQTTLARFRFHDGRRWWILPAPADSPLVVSQPGLLGMLIAEADACPEFRLLTGTTVTGLVREDERVVGIRTREGAGAIRARLVVGADGRASTVRRATALPVIDLAQGFDVLWMRLDLDDFLPDRETAHGDVASAQPIVVYPAPDGGHQLGLILPKDAAAGLDRAQRLELIRSRCSATLRRAVDAAAASIVGPVALRVVCDRLETWSEPGLLLVGDAAHTMSPVGGQGINMALRDAIVAANHLVPPLLAGASDDDLDRAAAAVARERLPEIREIQALQTEEGRRMLSPSRLGLRLMPLLARLPAGVLARMNRRRTKMRRGLAEVRLLV